MKYLILLTTLALAISSCTPTPKPISYGSDMCHFCKMTIVDQQHAAELVTKKGKVFMFDAIECMLNYEKEEGADFALRMVNVYETPKELIKAEDCHFLISKSLPSPMGAFLTAFKNEDAANKMQSEKGGKLFTWTTLQEHHSTIGFNDFQNEK